MSSLLRPPIHVTVRSTILCWEHVHLSILAGQSYPHHVGSCLQGRTELQAAQGLQFATARCDQRIDVKGSSRAQQPKLRARSGCCTCAIVSDGITVMQPRRVADSGADAVCSQRAHGALPWEQLPLQRMLSLGSGASPSGGAVPVLVAFELPPIALCMYRQQL